MNVKKNDKVVYIIFAVALIFFIITIAVLMFAKCADDPQDGKVTPNNTVIGSTSSPDSTTAGNTGSNPTSPVATPSSTASDPTFVPTPVPSHIIDKTVAGSVKQKYHIVVSLKAQIVYIYDMAEDGSRGELVKAMICSTGRAGNETPEKVWVVLENNINSKAKYRWQWLYNDVSGHYATRLFEVTNYGQSNESYVHRPYLFHSVPYDEYGENDTLQWEEWNKLGTPASDGCIRLAVEDSKWIYDHVAAYSYVFTVQGEEDPMLWNALKRDDIDASYKFDPTDYDYISSIAA